MQKKPKRRLSNYFLNHLRALCFAYGEMRRAPIANILTILVIAIALVLPYGLYRVLDGWRPLSSQISSQPHILVYTKNNLQASEIQQLQNTLENLPSVADISFISPKEGLKQFLQYTKLENIKDEITSNPLPAVFSLTPSLEQQAPGKLKNLVQQIQQLPNVQLVQLNMTWLKRLYYLIGFFQRMIMALGIIFSIGVILIVGNTIRLITQRHQEDITIMRLFGASRRFIRRPLLYRGVLLGLFGGVTAWIMIAFFLWWLASPLESLAQTYSNTMNINIFTFSSCVYLCVFGMLLAGFGAWMAVSPYLKQPEE